MDNKSILNGDNGKNISRQTPTKSGRKLPPIEATANEQDNKMSEVVKKQSIIPEAATIESKNQTIPQVEETKPEEPIPIKEVLIDSLDDIEKPGIFVTELFLPDMTNPKTDQKFSEEFVEFRREIHIFMSSFFIGLLIVELNGNLFNLTLFFKILKSKELRY